MRQREWLWMNDNAKHFIMCNTLYFIKNISFSSLTTHLAISFLIKLTRFHPKMFIFAFFSLLVVCNLNLIKSSFTWIIILASDLSYSFIIKINDNFVWILCLFFFVTGLSKNRIIPVLKHVALVRLSMMNHIKKES